QVALEVDGKILVYPTTYRRIADRGELLFRGAELAADSVLAHALTWRGVGGERRQRQAEQPGGQHGSYSYTHSLSPQEVHFQVILESPRCLFNHFGDLHSATPVTKSLAADKTLMIKCAPCSDHPLSISAYAIP